MPQRGQLGRWLLVVALVLAAVGCRPVDDPGTAENDRVADVVAVALSNPRPTSAASLQRHIASLPAGADGRLAVVAAEDLEAEELIDPLARLRWRVTTVVGDGGFGGQQRDVVTCYDVVFNAYGSVDDPAPAPCPENAPALQPPPVTDDDSSIGDPVPVCHSGSRDCPGG